MTSTELPFSNDDFPVQSIKNDTDYVLFIDRVNVFDVFIGSICNTEIFGNVHIIRPVKMPKPTCDDTNKDDNINVYKIIMIFFIILFLFMVIGLLILYFTGRLKF